MKSGFCPKCGSNEIHRYTHSLELSKLMQMEVKVSVTDYICFDCGYMESYLSSADIQHLMRQEDKSTSSKNKKPKRKNDE
jgi:predicted nucleic-acid-binding Zn-ribbon protein